MAQSFLYDPQSNYGYKGIPGPWGKAKSYMQTYPGMQDANLNPESFYTHTLASQGLGGVDNNSNIGRSLWGRVSDAYNAARLKNNQLQFTDFMKGVDINSMIGQMSSQEKGVNASNVVPFSVRWVPRS